MRMRLSAEYPSSTITTRNTPIGVVLREPSAAIHFVMCVRFLVQGLTLQKAVRGAIVVPLDSPCNNAVEFVFLSRGVWLLWACLFSRSRWGWPQNRAFRGAKVEPLDSPPLVCNRFLSQAVWLLWSCLFSRSGSGWPQNRSIRDAKVVPLDNPSLVCNNAVEFVFLS